LSDPAASWNPSDPNIKGLYKEFDTSETTVMDYSYAHAPRQVNGSTIQLYAGPPSGPFTLVDESVGTNLSWFFNQGSYVVPAGQNVTRFIFRSKENVIGNLLDAANFKANNEIKTADKTLTCSEVSTVVEAEGIGQWTADASNPAVTIIDTPNSKTTTISGFNTSGVYVYHWNTRYCDKTITITYQGINEFATVTTPVVYCEDQTASALTANAPVGYTLMWYTLPIGGIGSVTAPTPDTSATGSTLYYVSVVDPSGCIGARRSIEVVVNGKITPTVGFNYDAIAYCLAGNDPVMTTDAGFSTGGIFTATPAGLIIDATTGAITISGSTPGTYMVTYTVAENTATCNLGGTSNFEITVTETPIIQIDDACENQTLVLKALPVDGSFDPSTANYTWRDADNVIIGSNSETLNVDEYIAQNPSVRLPLTFTVTVESENCDAENSFTVTNNPCKTIPRGISPNNDGSNDAFDLIGMGVKELNIFNRYGTKVYSYKGEYRAQWTGLSDDGKELTDGTYFYSIHKDNGTTVTGWVYINRQY